MATTTTTTISNTLRNHFSKELLDHAVQATVYNQFAYQKDLPKKVGSKAISFFVRDVASAANVQTLTEGTPISTFTGVTYTKIDATLAQYGEAAKITDIVSAVELFDALQDNIELMAEDCALQSDQIIRNEVVAGVTTAGQKRYSQGNATFAALIAGTAAAGSATATDFLDAATQLRIQRAPKIGGYYIGVVCPQVSRDLFNDPDWLWAATYSSVEQLYRGELGRIHGVRFVETTVPFREYDTEGTYNAAQANNVSVFSSFVIGRQAYGCPKLAGESPFKPQVIITDKADKADPLNQFMTAGWKAFWTAKLLKEAWIVNLRSRTLFV